MTFETRIFEGGPRKLVYKGYRNLGISIVYEYALNQCKVFVGIENGKWHLSISHSTRYPNWGEIKEARYLLMPDDMTVAQILPTRDEWVNIHERCFHLWEIWE